MINPDSPYVREDIDHGLALVRAIVHRAGGVTAAMDEVLAWRLDHAPGVAARTADRLFARVWSFDTIGARAAPLD